MRVITCTCQMLSRIILTQNMRIKSEKFARIAKFSKF